MVIKPVPSEIPLPPSSSPSPPPPSSSPAWDASRDDDEMFLEEDDVSVSELNHLKKKFKKKKASSQAKLQHHHDFNNNNKRKREDKDSSTKTAEEEPGFNLTSGLHPRNEPNTHIPKAWEMRDNPGRKSSPSSLLYHKHAHFVFKKKSHTSRSEPHEDFAPLDPGHSLSQVSNWTLVPSNSFSSILLANQSYPHYHDHDHQKHHRSKRQSPDTVWPEVLLVVDYDSYLLHGGNSRDVKRYFISFWNGVDLRYKLLSHPRIRVSLAGMIVAKVSQMLRRIRKSCRHLRENLFIIPL